MLTTHPACGRSWSGARAEHCPACCQTFSGRHAGDMHRVGDHNDGTRRCLSPQEMRLRGLHTDQRGLWRLPAGDSLPPWSEAGKSSRRNVGPPPYYIGPLLDPEGQR